MEKEDPGHFGHRAPADCHTAAFFHRCIERPQTVTQLRSFIGAVTSYSDTFPHRSHILAPLTKLAGGRGTVKWNADCQKAFDQVKAMLATDAFLKYPDHNKPFHRFGDSSDLQLGAVLM
jgi:hypothetical protein